MPVRFAPARNAANSPIARILTRGVAKAAANDHAGENYVMSDNTEAALRHFAEHGLRAVPMALHYARRAATAAHDEDYCHWLEICRELDAAAAARFEGSQRPVGDCLIG